jgi:hypothetical protein
MAAVSSRMRLAAALEQATAAAEMFRQETAAQFAADKKTWKRVTGKRQRWERKMTDRLGTIDAAIAAMQTALGKL